MKRELNTGWEFRQAGSDSWQSATVPGVVHTDLLRNNKIEEPFFRTNEWDLQWIDKKDWEYRTEILLSADDLKYNRIEAVFEGLDTYAEVYINKEKVLDADNMFRTWTVNLKEVLTEGRNEIYLNFRSPITEDLPKLERLGYDLPAANDQSELGGLDEKRLSVFARKAGYHYGWDWGPRFVTMGIWRPVKLHFWNELKLEDVRIRLKSLENDKAVLGITAEIHALKSGDYDFQISSDDGNSGKTEKRFSVKEGPQVLSFDFQVDDPQLWWCNGLGDPYCYQINFAVSKNTQVLAEKTTTYGIRTIELVREKDSEGDGTSFYFKLNGIPVFAKGANYIPNDSFLPEVTDNRYRQVVDAAVDANMNMLRIWGGGIYESDLFYDLCDQAGIMIWQDFMFACSLYPGDEDFLNNIAHEVTDNVKRLRNHPCIVLWCGNNEIDIAWSHDTQGGWGWKEEYTPDQQKVLWNDYKKLFHELIPGKLAEMDEDRPYWPSSPQAGPDERSSNDAVSGDIHYWGVWHGQEPLENYNVHIGRFMSEFGLQSFPELETVKSYTIQEDWDIYSEVMQAHQKNKRKNGNAMISHYLLQHYREPKDFASFLYVNQVLQAKAIKTALEAHRRKKPYCMGSLYW
ncbi:MAG: glycoside hydrolase family 2 protein [FCB group bacterium]|nr:glycoside hydrolase family 2 protein [FCB group bacterium]